MPDTIQDVAKLDDHDILVRIHQKLLDHLTNYERECDKICKRLDDHDEQLSEIHTKVANLEMAEAREDGGDEALNSVWDRWGWLIQGFVLFIGGAIVTLILLHAPDFLGVR